MPLMVETAAAPAGWRRIERHDPFLDVNGPLFIADPFAANDEEPARFGFRVSARSCNFTGTLHGGLTAALLDMAMGMGMQHAVKVGVAPTVSLTVDYMRAAIAGDWLESRIRLLRQTRSMVFCDGLLIGPKGPIARGSGVFKLPPSPGS